MADLSITAANVLAGAGAITERGIAGATITAGQPVYKAASDSKYKLADDNSATAEVRVARGIALNSASDGQPLTILTSGLITIGATMVAQTAYYLGDTPGAICPVADLASGEFPCLLGMSTSTTVLKVDIQAPGGAL